MRGRGKTGSNGRGEGGRAGRGGTSRGDGRGSGRNEINRKDNQQSEREKGGPGDLRGKEEDGKPKGNQFSSTSSVDEEMRIRFTAQLHQLRESEVTEVQFPSTLTNVERKFLHKLSQELGLKSKSKGKGDDRYITVTKNHNNNNMKEKRILYQFQQSTITLLSHIFHTYPINSISRSQHHIPKIRFDQQFGGPISPQFYQMKQNLRLQHPDYHLLQQNRTKLPAYSHNDLVVHLIKTNNIVLVSGETGCGKTTQVPQFILDDPEIGPFCKIAVTQPRRLSAMAVSERIATERGEQVGDVVGYNIRLESECNPDTRIVFMTPGVLLRILQTDPNLSEWTHIIIDEAHERDRFTEFLFIILRDLIQNPGNSVRKPKLVLMSATMHIEKLSNYFGDIPHVHIGSSRFPVEEFYLEHILRFTGFRSPLGKKNSNIQGKSTSDQKVFRCPICNSTKKVFYSAVELATHVALCNGIDIDSGTLPCNLVFECKPEEQFDADDIEENNEILDDSLVPDNLDELLVTEDPLIVADVIGESSFAQAASRFVLSHTDDEIVTQYQKIWDDSMVDIELIHSLLKYIFRSEFSKDHGAVLVFLPGWDDISRLKSLLLSDESFRNQSKFRIHALHSGISKQAQREVFLPVPDGVYKIVLSTNIAETSVTIDNVTVVIDSGRSKEKSYDPHVKLSSLKENWISQSSANQRKGRAGRTRAGICFRLYSSRRYKALPTHQDSELTRTSLEELVLTTKMMGLVPQQGQVYNFLAKAMDPPHPLTVTNAINNLISLKCLDSSETITSLGRVLSQLPMDPFLSRALVLSALFGVLGSMIRLACAISYRDPFVIPGNDQQRALSKKMKALLSRGVPSDQMTIFYALSEYEEMLKQSRNGHQIQQFLDRHFLSRSTMTFLLDLEKQLHRSLESSIGISMKNNFTTRYERSEKKCIPLLLSLIGIGLYSTVAITHGSSNFTTEKGCKARIHPSSVNRKQSTSSNSNHEKNLEMIAYQELVAAPPSSVPGAANLLMISTCPVSIYTYLISCGSIEIIPVEQCSDGDDDDELQPNERGDESIHIRVDGWLSLFVSLQTLELVQMSRRCLDDALGYFLENPKKELPANHVCHITAITDALVFESPLNNSQIDEKREGSKSSSNGNDSLKTPKLPVEGKKLSRSQKK